MNLIHKDLDFQVRQVGGPEDRTLEFIGSTADVDRYGDIIDVAGWDVKNYLKNPVFLWAHDYSQPPVGKAIKVEKSDDGLTFRIQFASPEEYGFADTIYKLYLGGYLKATSVGFQGLEREPIMGKKDEQGYQEQTGFRYLKAELYELSAVPVPANPSAVMMAVQKGIISEKEAEPFLAKVAPASDADLIADLRKKVCALQCELEQVKAQASAPVKFDLVLSEEQLDKIRGDLTNKGAVPPVPETKAGAVLNAKNKAALQQAVALIGQVLTAAEPASDEGKGITPTPSIYSLALNPGEKPDGERQAGDAEAIASITESIKNLHGAVCR
jgi:HK97 family phage prohead protease